MAEGLSISTDKSFTFSLCTVVRGGHKIPPLYRLLKYLEGAQIKDDFNRKVTWIYEFRDRLKTCIKVVNPHHLEILAPKTKQKKER